MPSDWDTHKPLEGFFPRLASVDAVAMALRKKFGKRASAILIKLKNGQRLLHEELSAQDIITDLVGNDSEVVKTLRRHNQARNDQEEEYVHIMRFGTDERYCVYWIDHVDFPTGYFDSMKAAQEYAEIMYIA
jgi:hypothetical protein